jgi:CDP-6-deoxy-D-xylo-4-hexulose-3-dehydrase
MSTIEGGMVCGDDEQIQDLLLLIRNHGWPKDLAPAKEAELAKRYGAIEFNRTFTFYQPGFNVRSTDLNAKIGITQLLRLDDMIAQRVENHRAYQKRFLDTPGFHCQRNRQGVISSISFACLADSVEHRARIAEVLRENNVETRPLGGGNMSRQPFWSDRYGSQEMPMADRIHKTSFQLPNHHLLSVEDVNHICDLVTSVRP